MSTDIRTLAIVITPTDRGADDGLYALALADLHPGTSVLVRPSLEEVLVSRALDDVMGRIGRNRILVVGEESLADINGWLRLCGREKIRKERVEQMRTWAVEAEDKLPQLHGGHPLIAIGEAFDAINRYLEKDRILTELDYCEAPRIDALFLADETLEIEEYNQAQRQKEIAAACGDKDADAVGLIRADAKPRISRARTQEERRRILGLEEDLRRFIFGQDHAVAAVCEQMILARAGLQRPDRPLGSFLFAGPTGVGKTELARQLALALGVPLLRLDMSEYYDRTSISGLIGSVSGYRDSNRGGVLTNPVMADPNTLILLDEIEKGHPAVLQLLLQILDAGRLTDGRGHVVDFTATTVILTSNIGARQTTKRVALGFGREEEPEAEEIMASLERELPPELRNRLDGIMVFNRLDKERMPQFVDKALGMLHAQMRMRGTTISVEDEARRWLAMNGHSPDMGARPLDRLIDARIRRPAARMILQADETAVLNVGCDETGPNLRLEEARLPSPPDHSFIRAYLAKRNDEGKALMSKGSQSELATKIRTKRARSSPERVIIATPKDIGSLRRRHGQEEDDASFAAARIFLEEGEAFVDIPLREEVLVTTDLAALRVFIGASTFIVFDEKTLDEELAPALEAAGAPPLPPEHAEFMASRARNVGEWPGENYHVLGYHGGAGLNLPDQPDGITPYFAIRWIVEIFNFVVGIEEQKRLFDL